MIGRLPSLWFTPSTDSQLISIDVNRFKNHSAGTHHHFTVFTRACMNEFEQSTLSIYSGSMLGRIHDRFLHASRSIEGLRMFLKYVAISYRVFGSLEWRICVPLRSNRSG